MASVIPPATATQFRNQSGVSGESAVFDRLLSHRWTARSYQTGPPVRGVHRLFCLRPAVFRHRQPAAAHGMSTADSSCRQSSLDPIVEPMMLSWFQNISRISSAGLGPEVAPQVTIRPPLAAAFRLCIQVASPTESTTTSAPRLPVKPRTSRATWSSAIKVSSAPSSEARWSFVFGARGHDDPGAHELASCRHASDTPPPIP